MTSPIIHHVSVINRDRYVTFDFYHKLLGLEFLLKTVNQDEIEMIHLFFGDETGRPGTEFSVFEMPSAPQKKFGTNSLERTVFAVPSEASLPFWQARFEANDVFNCGIEHYQGRQYLHFEDRDGIQLALTPLRKGEASEHAPHESADIPLEHAILGIDSFQCRVRYAEASARAFMKMHGFQKIETYEHNHHEVTVLGGEHSLFGQQLHLIEDRVRDIEVQGAGSVQHIALNAKDRTYLDKVEKMILDINFRYSGIKQRDFFESLYYREPNNLLIEVATEQANFVKPTGETADYDAIPLFLPNFLESRRSYIESQIKR
ncbi:VOC family protein [Planomicrobium sp. CPCC 101079]|uniref:VOC family protein n=1 Tax=Planomicrobium sp. CPCC 101079 TaxID=2599618 RepID=UPI0011B587CD|nr:VOC family protein [Planomicrobium sp. CPCC 101079]TWT00587.1 ring-cleaving dioxygenase [Planomicrobium sp. CPCC 101079]